MREQMVNIKEPQSLEAREIADAIDDLRKSQHAEGTCKQHALQTRVQILLLRIGEQTLYRLQEHDEKKADEGELTLLGGKLLSMKGIAITGRDVVLLCLIAAMAAVALKEWLV